MMASFSALDRSSHLELLSQQQWDVLIIGGGITGAGILLDAVSRGLKAALVEKRDFAWGTSSRSTKLIHGGLRYLKQFEIGLVREVGRERAIVHRNARHIVRPEPMLLPMYKGGSIGKFTGAIGLWLYDYLADVKPSERRKILSAEDTIAREPLLRRDSLIGGGLYYEYRTDDARLTIEVLKKAAEMGGLALNYCEVDGMIYNDSTLRGVTCRDTLGERTMKIRAGHVINATGPWVDKVLRLDNGSEEAKKLLLTKGVHIVVDRKRLPLRQSLYFDVAEDDRMIFCIPRDGTVYIGTTDTVYGGSPDDIDTHTDDITYLLGAVNNVLSDVTLTTSDIISTWSGVRPLINVEGKSPSELSRKDEIFHAPSGLISIAGGKLTGYRKMAERIVDLIAPKTKSRTRDCRLSGGDFENEEDLQNQLAKLLAKYPELKQSVIRRLYFRYGSETKKMLDGMSLNGGPPFDQIIASEAEYSVIHEMSQSLTDFAVQRTAALYFNQSWLAMHTDTITHEFAALLGWDDKRQAHEKQKLRELMQRNSVSQTF